MQYMGIVMLQEEKVASLEATLADQVKQKEEACRMAMVCSALNCCQ